MPRRIRQQSFMNLPKLEVPTVCECPVENFEIGTSLAARRRPDYPRASPAPMPTPPPPPNNDPSQIALRSLLRRVAVILVAAVVVIAAFVIAWNLGAFTPSRR
jgi:hypothetical protein